MNSRRRWQSGIATGLGFGLVLLATAPARAMEGAGETPSAMVASYKTLADVILGAKKTEANLVRSILTSAHDRAYQELMRARTALKGNDAKGAQEAIENMAAAVGQIGSEGDASVGAVRKRLLEGGHHHNSDGEAKGIYDEGFVVVTKAAKAQFLEAAKALGQLAKAPKADALEAEWVKVEAAWSALMK
ncbi:MAG TPA: hypothetical protein VGS03_17330 [Candidatus Polarisedimenticolia bacterium]|jgi:hypothetical protein|nr:hypothetical protein [Candidatus Polarisedimenticolia bacterium]